MLEATLGQTVKIAIAIAGALGRMGQAVAAAVQADPALQLAGRFDRPGATGPGLAAADQADEGRRLILNRVCFQTAARRGHARHHTAEVRGNASRTKTHSTLSSRAPPVRRAS